MVVVNDPVRNQMSEIKCQTWLCEAPQDLKGCVQLDGYKSCVTTLTPNLNSKSLLFEFKIK